MSLQNLVARFNGTMWVYDVGVVKKGIEESDLTDEVKKMALRAIDESRYSKGKDFPTFNMILVLSREFNLRGDIAVLASVLDVIQNIKNATKEITIRK
jgi:hypothetical protein